MFTSISKLQDMHGRLSQELPHRAPLSSCGNTEWACRFYISARIQQGNKIPGSPSYRSMSDSLRTSMFPLALGGGHLSTLACPLLLNVHEATDCHPGRTFLSSLLLAPILSVCRPRGMLRGSAIPKLILPPLNKPWRGVEGNCSNYSRHTLNFLPTLSRSNFICNQRTYLSGHLEIHMPV